VHVANSSPIRYQQLFDPDNDLITFSNRGTSGIDGCLSTAAGFAIKNKTQTWLITGDVSFLYDSNAWWNSYRPDLKVILINNGGGGIFRILPGPKTIPGFETYFETNHNVNIKELCSAFDLMYFYADDIDKLDENFEKLKNSKNVSVLEIKTPRTLNAQILADYFKALNKKDNE
jgi:2-succinyl-5-enolpyruvyl-6-hydroxy-3-cyclohexene-1-carboxylate synthase